MNQLPDSQLQGPVILVDLSGMLRMIWQKCPLLFCSTTPSFFVFIFCMAMIHIFDMYISIFRVSVHLLYICLFYFVNNVIKFDYLKSIWREGLQKKFFKLFFLPMQLSHMCRAYDEIIGSCRYSAVHLYTLLQSI